MSENFFGIDDRVPELVSGQVIDRRVRMLSGGHWVRAWVPCCATEYLTLDAREDSLTGGEMVLCSRCQRFWRLNLIGGDAQLVARWLLISGRRALVTSSGAEPQPFGDAE